MILVTVALAVVVAGSLWATGVSGNTAIAASTEELPTISLRSLSLTAALELVIEQLDHPLVEMLYNSDYLNPPSMTDVSGAVISTVADAATRLPLPDLLEFIGS